MKAIIFFGFFFVTMILMPDGLAGSFVDHHIHISKDGEEAMDNFEFMVIATKATLSTVAALVALWLYRLKN
ncbi:hypothetical protein [Erwinia sp. 198]|uniref:hypothetical protein n=1 Tax=Erwinia sp. 198 TaxID=2022746 RepID=UPI000F6604C4|nr:hypothetical protein [Erwinia sp. 198]RRZ95772.1 hypothetical protein EGK14_04230 [Erwinia sp. 198]